MKNVTVSLDDETHRKARIHAAERGTSLSALVKRYLESLAEGEESVSARPEGVREMPLSYAATPASSPKPDTGPWLIDGTWSYTRDGKPRQPGALRGMFTPADDIGETPQWLIDAFEGKDTHLPWPEVHPPE